MDVLRWLTGKAERAMPTEITRLIRLYYVIGWMALAYLEAVIYDQAPWGVHDDNLDEMRATNLEEAA